MSGLLVEIWPKTLETLIVDCQNNELFPDPLRTLPIKSITFYRSSRLLSILETPKAYPYLQKSVILVAGLYNLEELRKGDGYNNLKNCCVGRGAQFHLEEYTPIAQPFLATFNK